MNNEETEEVDPSNIDVVDSEIVTPTEEI
jgi:hypothetical protein